MLAIISSRYHYGPFLFFVVAEVMSNYLTTDGLKNFFSTSGGPLRPEARGICHICHMVNPTLVKRSRVNGVTQTAQWTRVKRQHSCNDGHVTEY